MYQTGFQSIKCFQSYQAENKWQSYMSSLKPNLTLINELTQKLVRTKLKGKYGSNASRKRR